MLRHFTCAALIASLGSIATAQQEYCSAYFQARADWLAALGGNEATIQSMENYAETLWHSAPRDEGIVRLGPSARSLHSDTITQLMTDWAAQGGHLPLCMEDEMCIKCTAALHALQ